MKIKMNGAKPTDTLYENAPLHKAVSIITSKHLAALPVINEQGVFVGIIGANSLLALLLPPAEHTAHATKEKDITGLSLRNNNIAELRRRLSLMSNVTVGKLANRDVPVIYPDSPLMDAVLLLLDGGNEVAMVDRETRKFICMVSALDLLHTVSEGAGK
jgi:CBS-domain-containing membrane protein